MTDEEQLAKTKNRLCLGRAEPPCSVQLRALARVTLLLSLFNIRQFHAIALNVLGYGRQYCSAPSAPQKHNGFSKPRPVDNHPLSSAYLAVRCYYIYTARRR